MPRNAQHDDRIRVKVQGLGHEFFMNELRLASSFSFCAKIYVTHIVIKAFPSRNCGNDGAISGARARVLLMVAILQQILVLRLVRASGGADMILRHHLSCLTLCSGADARVRAIRPFHICDGVPDTTGHLVYHAISGVGGVLPIVCLQRAIVRVFRWPGVHNSNGRELHLSPHLREFVADSC